MIQTLHKTIKHIVPLVLLFFACGCATAYVSKLRCEYADDGRVDGVFFGELEYPCIFPATRIATTVEIPTWWCPSETRVGRLYEAWLWPIGAPLSLVDVVCSIVSDAIILPYDYCNVEDGRKL